MRIATTCRRTNTSIFPARSDQGRTDPAGDAHDDRRRERRPEPAEYVEAGQHCRHQPNHGGVHDQEKQAKGQNRQGQREKDCDRAWTIALTMPSRTPASTMVDGSSIRMPDTSRVASQRPSAVIQARSMKPVMGYCS